MLSPVGDLRYTPGRGLQVGHTGFALGGYATVNLTRNEGGPAAVKKCVASERNAIGYIEPGEVDDSVKVVRPSP